jgi:hypothetical protein
LSTGRARRKRDYKITEESIFAKKNRGLLGENNAKQQHNQVNTKIHGVFAGNVFLYTNPWCF